MRCMMRNDIYLIRIISAHHGSFGLSSTCALHVAKAGTPLRRIITDKEGREVPRKGSVPKREVLPDPVYGSVVVTKLVKQHHAGR